MADPVLVGKGEEPVFLYPKMTNRHGLIAGATGTGKTVTLQVLAEGMSRLGVPVFLADVKGDLSGLACGGKEHPKISERLAAISVPQFEFRPYPVTFWDVFGAQGHPVRTTVSEMGPLLLASLLELNETQEAVLTVTFRVADDQGLLLLDLKDLRAMVQWVGENAKEISAQYGNVSKASVGAIQRSLLQLEQQGADRIFGEPALNIFDLLRSDADGRGFINILAADRLMQYPRAYGSFLLWLLSELFENLPEVGDLEKPKLVFFFDEAHLLFDDASKALREKIEQVARLIRSKGVGVFFISQNPLDIPQEVLGQLGNRFQHALRAFTPKDQKAVKAAAETFRANPHFSVSEVITQLGVGEALVSTLDLEGTPHPVEKTLIRPPESRIGPASAEEREGVLKGSLLFGRYENAVDRESAYEMLQKRAQEKAAQPPASQPAPKKAGRRSDNVLESFAKSTARAVGSSLGRRIVRGILGSLLGDRR